MWHRYLWIACGLLVTGWQVAAAQAEATTVDFQDAKRPAFTTDYDYPADLVTEAIREHLRSEGVRASVRKGVISSMGVTYPALQSSVIDLYFMVKEKGRKGRGGSTVYMLLSRGRDNFISADGDPETGHRAVVYLVNLRRDIETYALRQQIEDVKKSVDRKSGSYKGLLKDKRKLESKRYDEQRALSDVTDAGQQAKHRKKVAKLDKSLRVKEGDIQQALRELEELKTQLNTLQDRLRRADNTQ